MAEAIRTNPLHPVLLIGLGGTGSRVLTHVRANLQRRFGRPTLPFLRILGIDSDAVEQPPRGILAEEERRVPIAPEEYLHLATSVSDQELPPNVLEWFPETLLHQLRQPGALSMKRPYARLLFFLNYQSIRERISALLCSLRTLEMIRASQDWMRQCGLGYVECFDQATEVHLFASLAGSVGSGTLLDVAFLLRSLAIDFPIETTTHAHLFLPCRAGAGPSEQHMYANAYAALQELELFSSRLTAPHDFEVEWQPGRRLCVPGPPFNEIYLGEEKAESGCHLPLEHVLENTARFVIDRTLPSALSLGLRSTLGPLLFHLRYGKNLIYEAGRLLAQETSSLCVSHCAAEIRVRKDRIPEIFAYRLEKSILELVLDGNAHGSPPHRTLVPLIPDRIFDDLQNLMQASLREAMPIRSNDGAADTKLREWFRLLHAINIDSIRLRLEEKSADIVLRIKRELEVSSQRLCETPVHGIKELSAAVEGYLMALNNAQAKSFEQPEEIPDWVIGCLEAELIKLGHSKWPDLFGRRQRRKADLQGDLEAHVLRGYRLRLTHHLLGLVARVVEDNSLTLSGTLSVLKHVKRRIEDRLREIAKAMAVLSPGASLLTWDVLPSQEDLNHLYTLDHTPEGSPGPVQADSELRRCIEDIRAHGVTNHTDAVLTNLLNHLPEYCRSRFEADFQRHPRNFDVFSSLPDSKEAASWLAFRAAPLLCVSQPPHASVGTERAMLSIPNAGLRANFIKMVDDHLRANSGRACSLDVVDSEDTERIVMRIVRVGLPLCVLPTVSHECKRAYERFVMEDGRGNGKSLYLDAGWNSDTRSFRLKGDWEDAIRETEATEVLLFGPMLRVLSVEGQLGSRTYAYRRGAPRHGSEPLGTWNRAKIVLRNERELRENMVAEIERREAELSLDARVRLATAMREFLNSAEVDFYGTRVLLEKKCKELSDRIAGTMAPDPVQGASDPTGCIEWLDGMPVLTSFAPWSHIRGNIESA